ncbi:MAG: chemotaxis protein CheW [Eubacteriales bacterium]
MKQVIKFLNNSQSFALNISKTERIIEFQKPQKVPQSSSYLLGVIQYNNRILPIIDLTKRFYHTEAILNDDAKIIVILWKETQIGIVVDEIVGIKTISDEDFEESACCDMKISREYVLGFIKTKEDITILLDPDTIFDAEEQKELFSLQD